MGDVVRGKHHAIKAQQSADDEQILRADRNYEEKQQQPVREQKCKGSSQPKTCRGGAYDPSSKFSPQQNTSQCLAKATDNAAGKIQGKEWPSTDRLFNLCAKDVDCPAVEHKVQKPAVHEHVGQQLPDMSLLQTRQTQGEVIV